MSVKSNRQKGKDLENYVADLLVTSGLDRSAIRQIGSGSGTHKGDVHNQLGWTFECKNTKKFDFKSTAEQVAREAMGYQKEAIIWHPPNRPMEGSVAILNIADFMELLKIKEAHKSSDQILDKWQIKNNLEKAVYHLKQVVKDL